MTLGFRINVQCAHHAETKSSKNFFDLLQQPSEEWFALKAWWRAANICHACHMTKVNFATVPNPLKNVPRRGLRDFLQNAIDPGERSFLVYFFCKDHLFLPTWGPQRSYIYLVIL